MAKKFNFDKKMENDANNVFSASTFSDSVALVFLLSEDVFCSFSFCVLPTSVLLFSSSKGVAYLLKSPEKPRELPMRSNTLPTSGIFSANAGFVIHTAENTAAAGWTID